MNKQEIEKLKGEHMANIVLRNQIDNLIKQNKKYKNLIEDLRGKLKAEFCMGECSLSDYDKNGVCPNCRKVDSILDDALKNNHTQKQNLEKDVGELNPMDCNPENSFSHTEDKTADDPESEDVTVEVAEKCEPAGSGAHHNSSPTQRDGSKTEDKINSERYLLSSSGSGDDDVCEAAKWANANRGFTKKFKKQEKHDNTH